jgi:serine/threonine-protein kinase RsbW
MVSAPGFPYHAGDIRESERTRLVTEQDVASSGREGLLPNEVEVRIAADAARLSTIRAMAADIAVHEDFDLDALSDLALAVDEACVTVLAGARPGAVLVCRLLVTPEYIELNTTAAVLNGYKPAPESLGWHVLQVLTDSADYWTSDEDGEHYLHVRITKSRR